MKKLIFLLLAVIFACILFSTVACQHEIVNPNTNDTKDTIVVRQDSVSGWRCSADTVYFLYDVQPVLISSCAQAGCHDAVSKAEGYQLTDYASTMKKGIVPNLATSSKVYAVIYNGSMPQRSSGVSMTQAQKDIIAKWINQGAKNLNCNPSFGVCDTTSVKFASFVQPLIQNQCQGCHGATNPSGGLSLTNYTQIKASVQSGRFLGSIKQLIGFSKMPVGGRLSDCELKKISAWINQGILNN